MLGQFLKEFLSIGSDEQPKPLFPENEAKIEEVIVKNQVWFVSYSASFWEARSLLSVALSPGETVYVIGRQGNTLLIEPSHSAHSKLPENVDLMSAKPPPNWNAY